MKTDRFAILLAGLLLAAGFPAAGQISIRLGGVSLTLESDSKKLAKELAQQVGEVQKGFDTNRRALRTTQGSDGKPAYLRQEVAGLITRTGEDLDQAIERIGEPGLAPLGAWSAEEFRRIQEEVPATPGRTAFSLPGLSTPRAVAVVARLGGFPPSGLARLSSAVPQPETIPAETSNSLLDEVGEVVGRIFFLAAHDDLEVKLWVGSTPAPRAAFSFWSQGKVKGTTPAQTTIRTNGKKDHILRGLYHYRAALTQGAVTELVQYPSPAGSPAARMASERLDLVNGTRFFCCRFDEQYCHHVDDEKECRP